MFVVIRLHHPVPRQLSAHLATHLQESLNGCGHARRGYAQSGRGCNARRARGRWVLAGKWVAKVIVVDGGWWVVVGGWLVVAELCVSGCEKQIDCREQVLRKPMRFPCLPAATMVVLVARVGVGHDVLFFSGRRERRIPPNRLLRLSFHHWSDPRGFTLLGLSRPER